MPHLARTSIPLDNSLEYVYTRSNKKIHLPILFGRANHMQSVMQWQLPSQQS